MATNSEGESPVEIKTDNEWGIATHQNLGNHSASVAGFPRFVRQMITGVPLFRTKQATYRYAAWLISIGELLPDEPGQEGIEFEQVLEAVRNS